MKNRKKIRCVCLTFILILFYSTSYGIAVKSSTSEWDNDADGVIDTIYYLFYKDCNIVENRMDNDADGVIDYISYVDYYADGYITIMRHDDNADGVIDTIWYEREETVGDEYRRISEVDEDADNIIDWFFCIVTIENEGGVIVNKYEGDGEYNGSGDLVSVSYVTQDGYGRDIKEEFDEDANGTIDEVTYSYYDGKCLPYLTETDLDNDGDIDTVTQTSYDDKCRVTGKSVDRSEVTYGIEYTSRFVTEHEYTDDVYGNETKLISRYTSSNSTMGQTFDSDSQNISYSSYEYIPGDCEECNRCPDCTGSATEPDDDCDEGDCSNSLLTQTQVSQLYVAIFGRASEGDGNTYWSSLQSDMAIAANTMLDTEPAKAYFGNTLYDDQAFIEFIYQNTLGKTYAEDPSGVDYWVNLLSKGKSKGEVVADLINAAIDPQYVGLPAQDQFLNKVELSNYTAAKIASVPDVNDLSAFVNFISEVTDDPATVVAAKAAVDAF